MQNKKIILWIVVAVLLVVILIFGYLIFKNQSLKNQPINPFLAKDEEIISILKTNKDIEIYTEKYPDFKINNKVILTKDSILAGQNDQNFQPVYLGLDLEDNRYMKVDLMDQLGSNGFIGVIDFKNNSVTKAFGILLLQAQASVKDTQNGK